MPRYRGFQEWLLDEHGEESGMRRAPVGPVKQETLDMLDALYPTRAQLRHEDAKWHAKRKKWLEDWKANPTDENLAEHVDHLCEQLRNGK